MLYALCFMLYALCFMLYALCFMLYALCFIDNCLLLTDHCLYQIYIFFFLTNNQITTGAPNNEVTAFIGNVNSLFGNWAKTSQINMIIPPKIAEAGNNIL